MELHWLGRIEDSSGNELHDVNDLEIYGLRVMIILGVGYSFRRVPAYSFMWFLN